MVYMYGHHPKENTVLGVDLSSHQDASPGPLTASEPLIKESTLTKLVHRIRDKDATAAEQLYPKVLRWLEYCCGSRQAPDESEDRVQETYLAILKAIQQGELREPEKLMAFMRVIGHRHYCAYIKRRNKSRSSQPDNVVFETSCRPRYDAEHDVLGQERRSWAQDALAKLAPREREILERFYLCEESPDKICNQMNLTSDQFRLLKWRAKAKVTFTAKKNLRVSAFRSSLLKHATDASKSLQGTGRPNPLTLRGRNAIVDSPDTTAQDQTGGSFS
jgi:RNA polymerase sigma factor (sigma-70 family)